MVQYDRVILNMLLDTYESSLLSTGENRRNIHIEFRFTKKALPAYFDESSSEYERIHFFMESLEEKQLLRICWQGKRKGHPGIHRFPAPVIPHRAHLSKGCDNQCLPCG